MRVFKYATLAIVVAAVSSTNTSGQQADGELEMLPIDCVEVYQLQFAEDADRSLSLDLYIPEKASYTPPLLVLIHGHGSDDSKARLEQIMLDLTANGYAVASFDSQPGGRGARPRHVQECKGAIRWLRVHADKYGYDANRIGVVGGAGGATLALMLGVSADVDELEGRVAGHLDQSSRVHAVVSLPELGSGTESREDRDRSGNQKPPSSELLSARSSLRFLTPDDAPLLIIQDNLSISERVSQGRMLSRRHQEAGLETTLCTLGVEGHDRPHFSDQARYAMIESFFDKHIKQIKRDIFADAPQASPEIQAGANSNGAAEDDRRRRRRDVFGKRFAERGAQVGEMAPDATVFTLAGETLTLSSLWEHKPTLLVTGSVTCPIASRSCPSLAPLQDQYGDEVNVVILYQREAHPKPENPSASRPSERFRGTNAEQYQQPKTLDERMRLAKLFDEHLSSTVRIVVADISDDVNVALATGPNIGLLIDRGGKIVVKQGWYDGEAVRTEVAKLLVREAE